MVCHANWELIPAAMPLWKLLPKSLVLRTSAQAVCDRVWLAAVATA